MPRPQAICLEDVSENQSDTQFMQCVAVPGRDPGLGLDADGQIQWQSDTIRFELWITAEDTLALFRRADAPVVIVERAGRELEIPCEQPAILLAGDVIKVRKRHIRVHLHGVAPTIEKPTPFVGVGDLPPVLIPKKRKRGCDIIFLIDATADMQPALEGIKRNISTFVDSMRDTTNQSNPVRDWRAKVVGYRDFIDDPASALEDNPFVAEAATVHAQLNALEAKFGGDLPESLLDAIYHVANMGQTEKGAQEIDPNKWRYRSDAARIVIIFTNAPYHPTTKDGGTLEDIVLACHSNRVLLFIFAPEMDCYDELVMIDKAEYEAIEVQSGEEPADALARLTSDPDAFKQAMIYSGMFVRRDCGTGDDDWLDIDIRDNPPIPAL